MSVSNAESREVGQKFAGLPMPYDRQMLFDLERRPRLLDPEKRRFPFPVPNGWFVVAEAKDLAPGEVMPFFAFGKDLVLYRTEGGEPRVIDAHCPHLGAHIGVGGSRTTASGVPSTAGSSTGPPVSARRCRTTRTTSSPSGLTPGRTRPSSATR